MRAQDEPLRGEESVRSEALIGGGVMIALGHCRKRRRAMLLACALGCLAGNAVALDAVALMAGRAPGVSSLRGALIWAPPRDQFLPRWLDWTGADPRLELGLSVWLGQAGGNGQRTLLGVGAIPLLRWKFAGSAAGEPFVDFGVGPRLLTGTSIAPGHRFGSVFEFGSILGAGLRRGDYDFFLRLEHTSNGGFRQPNPGLDFVQIGVARSFGR